MSPRWLSTAPEWHIWNTRINQQRGINPKLNFRFQPARHIETNCLAGNTQKPLLVVRPI